jgi:hypothetical protein
MDAKAKKGNTGKPRKTKQPFAEIGKKRKEAF